MALSAWRKMICREFWQVSFWPLFSHICKGQYTKIYPCRIVTLEQAQTYLQSSQHRRLSWWWNLHPRPLWINGIFLQTHLNKDCIIMIVLLVFTMTWSLILQNFGIHKKWIRMMNLPGELVVHVTFHVTIDMSVNHVSFLLRKFQSPAP